MNSDNIVPFGENKKKVDKPKPVELDGDEDGLPETGWRELVRQIPSPAGLMVEHAYPTGGDDEFYIEQEPVVCLAVCGHPDGRQTTEPMTFKLGRGITAPCAGEIILKMYYRED